MSKMLINPSAVVAIEVVDCGSRQCIEVVTVLGKIYYAESIEVVEEYGREWLAIKKIPPRG